MEKSKLREPVGKVSALFDPTTGKMTGVVIVNLVQAPEGSELYVQPNDSRLALEVEVATDNALHWREKLGEAHIANSKLREQLRDMRTAMRNLLDNDYINSSVVRRKIREMLGDK